MRFQIAAPDVPPAFPFSDILNQVGAYVGLSPTLLAAFAYVETLSVLPAEEARTYLSFDNGHGLFQLTSAWPDNWRDVHASAIFAADKYILPAMETWYHDYGYTGDTLIRCVAATYNAGPGNALRGHFKGDVGTYTTKSEGVNYDARVLIAYKTLSAGSLPPLPN